MTPEMLILVGLGIGTLVVLTGVAASMISERVRAKLGTQERRRR